MKILLVLECASLKKAEISGVCHKFASELRSRGHEVKILGAGNDETLKDRNFISLKKSCIPFFGKNLEKEGFVFAKVQNNVIYEAIRWCDVLHFFLPTKLSNTCRLIAETLDKPVTGGFYMTPENMADVLKMSWLKSFSASTYKRFKKRIYRHVKHIHCSSKDIAEKLTKYGYEPSVLHVFDNEVDEISSLEEMFITAKKEVRRGKDFSSLYPCGKDKRESRGIFNALNKYYMQRGFAIEIPEKLY